MKKDYWLYTVAASAGILVWVIIAWISDRREAWDSPAYLQIGIPALCLMSTMMGYLSPDRPWRWGAVPLGAQALWVVATQGVGNLWPLALIMIGILAVPPIQAARLGAYIHRRTARQSE